MFQAELRCALRFVFGELGKVIEKSGGRTAVKTGPERRFADGLAAGERHAFVIVSRAADHVGVRFNIAHFNDVQNYRSRQKKCQDRFHDKFHLQHLLRSELLLTR
jgi:hypothetical protein